LHQSHLGGAGSQRVSQLPQLAIVHLAVEPGGAQDWRNLVVHHCVVGKQVLLLLLEKALQKLLIDSQPVIEEEVVVIVLADTGFH
jgi:hypothetical protein